jgi:PAS domain S-box-containing protein
MRQHRVDDPIALHQLRQQAEAALQQAPPGVIESPERDPQRLLYELQVHQAELAIQNEELRRQQLELTAARDKYAALYEFAPVGYVTLDARGTILEANPTAATLLGVPRGSLVGTPLAGWIARDDQDAFYFYRRQVFETHTTQTCNLRLQRLDATVLVAHLESCTLAGNGGPLNWPPAADTVAGGAGPARQCLTALSDITARKQAEEALQAAHDELEQRVLERTTALAAAYEELRHFADVVSHDLRAPLINVQGFTNELAQACEVLQAVLPTALPSLDTAQRAAVTTALEGDIPEALDFIHAGVARMNGLLEAMFRLSRMGHRPLHVEAVDMEALVQQCLQTLEHQLREHQVDVIVGPLPQIHADALAMTQIVSHLLSNAIKALVPGRPGELRITAAAGPETTAFHIQDNGRGIAADDIPKVFEVFRGLGPQEIAGAGMGLAYVRTLARRHGGDVRCQSTLGVGTTFTFTIAKHLADGPPQQAAGTALP